MNTPERIQAALRRQLDLKKQQLVHYKHLYTAQRREAQTQNNIIRTLRANLNEKEQDLTRLNAEIRVCRAHINGFKVPRGYKKWQHLISPISRAKRKAAYRKCLDHSMLHLHEAERVHVSMKIATQEVVLVWSKHDLQSLRAAAPNIIGRIPPQQNNVVQRPGK